MFFLAEGFEGEGDSVDGLEVVGIAGQNLEKRINQPTNKRYLLAFVDSALVLIEVDVGKGEVEM